MRHSKRSLEGYYLEDNRASGGQLREHPIVTCAHCQFQIVLNPGRTRDRDRCARCDKYICDGCALTMKITLECHNFQRQLDAFEAQVVKALTRGLTVDPRIVRP
jgi:hypothetical protein